MQKKSVHKLFNKAGYSLLELLVVLSITSVTMGIVLYGMIKFRRVMIVSSATKELSLQLRKARRYAINNVVTEEGASTSGYYIEVGDDDFKWGECDANSVCSSSSVVSSENKGVSVSGCKAGGKEYSIIKFSHVTGEFNISDDPANIQQAGMPDKCIIEIKIEGFANSKKEVEVDRESRTIKIL